MDDYQAQLLSEQFNRLKDSIESRFQRIEKDLSHHNSLEAEKLAHIQSQISGINEMLKDHESRIRTIDDSVISSNISAKLMQAGQAALTLIAAAIAAWLGGRR